MAGAEDPVDGLLEDVDRTAGVVELPPFENEPAVAPAQLHHIARARVAQRQLGEVLDRVVRPRPVERLRHRDLFVGTGDRGMARRALFVVDVTGSGEGNGGQDHER